MAEGSSQEKTEDATPRRLREARKKGQIPKSRDISMVLVMVVIIATMAATMGWMGGLYRAYFELCFKSLGQEDLTANLIWKLSQAGLITMFKTMAPMLIAGMAVAVLSGIVQTGGLFTAEPLKPNFEKLNPIEGLKNMFKAVTFIELIKNMIKLAVVFYLAYSTITKYLQEVLMTMKVDMFVASKITGMILFEFIMKVAIIFIFLSMADYAIQRWNFMKNMRMTKEEVKKEYKQDEGDPAIKGERRRLHREMAFGDARAAVKKSDAVITNPIHVACAISYNKEEMAAPQLQIKGQRAFAEMIIDIAREEGIPIVRNIPLAWALVHLDEGTEIPEDLYEAVAEVLTYVYQLKQKQEASAKENQNKNNIYV